jgi:hypothetical protein
MRRQPTAMPRERMQPGRHLVLSVLCLLAGTSVPAASAESPEFVVVDHNGASLLPARPLRFIDNMRGEAIRRLAEQQLDRTVNVLSKELPITTFAARLTWQPHDLTVTTFSSGAVKDADMKVATLSLYLEGIDGNGMWRPLLWATGTDGRTCFGGKYDPDWAITIGDLIAAYYLRQLPAP